MKFAKVKRTDEAAGIALAEGEEFPGIVTGQDDSGVRVFFLDGPHAGTNRLIPASWLAQDDKPKEEIPSTTKKPASSPPSKS